MPKLSEMNKTDRLRHRLFFQYGRENYVSAARLGEALLRAHVRLKSDNTAAYETDLYNTALACAGAGRVNRAVDLYTESIHKCFLRSGINLTIAARLTNLGALLSDYGQHDNACRIFLQVITIKKRFMAETHPDYEDALYNLDNALMRSRAANQSAP